MRECILPAILRTQDYTRSRGRCLYAKETMNNCNTNEVTPATATANPYLMITFTELSYSVPPLIS